MCPWQTSLINPGCLFVCLFVGKACDSYDELVKEFFLSPCDSFAHDTPPIPVTDMANWLGDCLLDAANLFLPP